MAISPDQVSESLTVQRIAQLLTCHNDPDCSDPAMVHGDKWMEAINEAIEAEKLQPVEGKGERTKVNNLWKDTRKLSRENVLAWLRSKGATDKAIPPGLRQYGDDATKAEGEKPSYLLTIAALVELLKESERPNNQTRISISIADDPRNKGVTGLSKSNLDKLFADANRELAEARK